MSSQTLELPAHTEIGRLERLARKALHEWGLEKESQLELVKHRENAVFKVTDEGGNKYALRVHRLGYHTDQSLASELAWMNHLGDQGFKTPRPVPTVAGQNFVTVSTGSVPEGRQCDLIQWTEGPQIGNIESGVSDGAGGIEDLYRSIGAMAGRLHEISINWNRPADFSRMAWDEHGTMGEDPLWGRFSDLDLLTEAQTNLLFQAKTKALKALEEFGKGDDRFGLVHADLLPENILQTSDGLCLIDFDDSGFGWHLFEFATSLFIHLGEPNFDAICAAMVEGYRSERSLPDSHLAFLPTFFMVRGLVYLGWLHTRRETKTAQLMTPILVEVVVALATDYVDAG